MNELTRSEVVRQAEEYATPLNKLIAPSDVEENADSWGEVDSETLRREISMSTDIILSERRNHRTIDTLLEDYARQLWCDSFVRVPMKHLATDCQKEAVLWGYWPYSMDKWELSSILEERNDIPTECYDEARDAIVEGLTNGMMPPSHQD